MRGIYSRNRNISRTPILALFLVIMLLLAVGALEVQSGEKGQSKSHLPHAHEIITVPPTGLWTLIVALVTIFGLVFFWEFVQDVYKVLKNLVFRCLSRLGRTRWFKWAKGRLVQRCLWRIGGHWSNATAGVFLWVARRVGKPWYLNFKDQGYKLTISKFDQLKATAEGDVWCKRRGHHVGEWSWISNSDSPNLFDFHLKLCGAEPVIVTLTEPD